MWQWWNDELLDAQATRLMTLHAQNLPRKPWFMGKGTIDASEVGQDALWLSEEELAVLEELPEFKLSFSSDFTTPAEATRDTAEQIPRVGSAIEDAAQVMLPKQRTSSLHFGVKLIRFFIFPLNWVMGKVQQRKYYKVFSDLWFKFSRSTYVPQPEHSSNPLPSSAREIIKVPLALLVSFSRRVKESDAWAKHKYGPTSFSAQGYAITGEDWSEYLGLFWRRHAREREHFRDIGTGEHLFKATKIFFHWLKTGKIVAELDNFVDKHYLLLFARGLGAPLFRAAILEQIPTPPGKSSLGGGPNNHPTTEIQYLYSLTLMKEEYLFRDS